MEKVRTAPYEYLEQRKPIIFFGAGQVGKQAIEYYGCKNTLFFVDNHKAGLYYCGKPVISVDDLLKLKVDYQLVISTSPTAYVEIEQQLERAGIYGAAYFGPAFVNGINVSNPHLEQFKNIHKEKRCFLIGNGPSLRAEDLVMIKKHGDISFASNKIYKIYEYTDWRPDFYFSSDQLFMTQNWNDIIAVKGNKFLSYADNYITPDMLSKLTDTNNIFFFQSTHLDFDFKNNAFLPFYLPNNEPYPSFSEDTSKFVYEGFSVTYLMMQWAAYMGFSELILLGVDHNYKHTCNNMEKMLPPQKMSGTVAGDYFSDHYFKEGELIGIADTHSTELAYIKAEQYSREHGFRIYNATRGGKLEVFERVDFDELFS